MRIRWGSALITTALVASTMAWLAPAQADAPSNDAFAQAQVLDPSATSFTGTTNSATEETGEPTASDGGEAIMSVWYSWTPSVSGEAELHMSDSQTAAAYTGSSVAQLTRVSSVMAYDSGEIVFFHAVAGTTYHLQVAATSAGEAEAFTVWLSNNGGFSGTVTDATGKPVPDVIVTAFTPSSSITPAEQTFTNSNGLFSLPLGAGSYDLEYAYRGQDPSVNVAPALLHGSYTGLNAATAADLPTTTITDTSVVDASRKLAAGGQIEGTIAIPAGVDPSTVQVEQDYYDPITGDNWSDVMVDASGHFVVSNGPASLSELWLTANGNGMTWMSYPGTQDETAETLLATQPGCTLQGIRITPTADGSSATSTPPTNSCSGVLTPKATLVDANHNGRADAGEKVDYDLAITNHTGYAWSNVAVKDATVPALTTSIASVAGGATVHVTASHTLTAADIAAGKVSTSATVTGTSDGAVVQQSAPESFTAGTATLALSLPKLACTATAAYAAAKAKVARDQRALAKLKKKFAQAKRKHRKPAARRLAKQVRKAKKRAAADAKALAGLC